MCGRAALLVGNQPAAGPAKPSTTLRVIALFLVCSSRPLRGHECTPEISPG